MGLKDITQALKRRPFLEKRLNNIGEGEDGFEVSTFAGKKAHMGRNDSIEQIESKLDKLSQERRPMSITGAANLAGTIKDRINSAKARIASVSTNIDSGLGKLNAAADTGDKIAKQIESEADDLLSQIGQFSNGGPE